jgi:phospholipase/lecithinase/hemolysin
VDAAVLLAAAQKALVAAETEPARVLQLWFGGQSFFADVVHPSRHGHAVMAQALAPAILAAVGGE